MISTSYFEKLSLNALRKKHHTSIDKILTHIENAAKVGGISVDIRLRRDDSEEIMLFFRKHGYKFRDTKHNDETTETTICWIE